ncbi:SET domain-containing protein [Schizophyllum commune H4-8]|nr:SET domain-containing protein [Schizophyllum commune H4-8]KAI5900760.1 SET domain-containing protein [Schizophyllum commune H4-8]
MNCQVSTLLTWCAREGIFIDDRLHVVAAPSGISVCSKQGDISPDETVVTVPRTSALSLRNCTFRDHVPDGAYEDWDYNHLKLAFALYSEILLDRQSRWYGYLQALPESAPDLPLFWNLGTTEYLEEDGKSASRWLQGTEADRLRGRKETEASPIEVIRQFYRKVVAPFSIHSRSLPSAGSLSPKKTTFDGFIRAYALVCSRAFVTDLYYGLCMIPIADAFNHHVQNHVQLAVEEAVCPQCGAFDACLHDSDVPDALSDQTSDAEDPTFDMVATTYIPPGTEVFNTYGETLTNAQLLLSYGFILKQNDNDHLSWDPAEPDLLGPDAEGVLDLYRSALEKLPAGSLAPLLQSELVEQNTNLPPFSITGEGTLNGSLWLLLVVQILMAEHRTAAFGEPTAESIVARLPATIATQLYMEASDEDRAHMRMKETELDEAAIKLPRLVRALCRRRRERYFGAGTKAAHEVVAAFDNVPETWTRTRTAMTLLIGERALLDTCECLWVDLAASFDATASGWTVP